MEIRLKIIFGTAMCFVLSLPYAEDYRILGVFPHMAKSHFVMTGSIMKELAKRGHQVVVISPFPEKNPPNNYTDIVLPRTEDSMVESFEVEDFRGKGNINLFFLLYNAGARLCEHTFSTPGVQKLLKSSEKFDLVLVEIFNTDCYLAFGHRFNASFVGISSSTMAPWANSRFGNPDNPSYIPLIVTDYSDRMSFTERLANSVLLVSSKIAYKFTYNIKADQIVRRHLGESTPSIEEIASKMSLFLVNTHFSLHQSRPLVPAVVEVGGIHVKVPKAIPQRFDKFLNESEHGVIYFNLGSSLRTDSFPEAMRNAFLEAFSELPQRVLWKWESGSMPGQPSNVMIAKWMPQIEILSHPKVKVFITHGGLMGTTEAAYFGVPMVAIPLFGDQFLNVRSFVDKGIAVELGYNAINKNTVLAALTTVLDNPSYAENAKRISELLHDRPMSPMDTAIYWIEYVIRHGGAPHLRSAAADLTWYQYLMLDVVAVLLLGAAVITTIIFLLFRAAARKIFGQSQRQDDAAKHNRKIKQS